MKKRGQFYLLAAIIIISIIIGFAAVSNYSKKKTDVKLYDLGDELGIEGGEVLDYGVYDPNSLTTIELLEDFTGKFSEYAGEEKDIYFVFGDSEIIYLATWEEINTGSISIGGVGLSQTGRGYNLAKISPPESPVKVEMKDKEGNINEYEFELRPGDNFYFILSQEVGEEKHVTTG